jgi:septal ring factor EnvC (AmiA/AmiB activator)
LAEQVGRSDIVVAGACVLCLIAFAAAAREQSPTELRELSRQAEARIRELQAEADRLAQQTGTILGELRALELQREIRSQELKKADADAGAVLREVESAAERLQALEAQRLAETPGMRERLVEIYKRGRAGYLRLLLAADDLRALGRLSRGVAAIAQLDRVRLDAHRQIIRAQREALAEVEQRRAALAAAQEAGRKARAALDRAVAAHNARLDALDRQRDLAARYVGELQAAQTELQNRVSRIGSGETPALPLAPFRGALDWPVAGRLLSRFRTGGAAPSGTSVAHSGIEIAAADGSPARAVHPGTVAFAAPFTGFGTLVIVDHGQSAFTLYGYLSQAAVAAGARVNRGTIVGRTGRSPAGTDALYFELRIDGRPVDPVQWLRSPR